MESEPREIGVIFDMDGVLSDTQTLHATIESALLRDVGIVLSPEAITARFAGVQDLIVFKTVLAEHAITDVRAEELFEKKWVEMNAAAARGVRAMTGAIEAVTRLHALGFPLAVASGSPRSYITTVLESLSLVHLFTAYVSADEVVEGKPAPFVFLEAASRSSVKPERCVVIEDGLSGMIAAKRAGMKCIAFDANRSGREWPADIVIDDLYVIDERFITELIN